MGGKGALHGLPMFKSRPTLDDVARVLGVSGKTVARAINGEAGVSEKRRAHILQVAQDLGYQSNHSARALASSRSFRIGILSPWLTAFFVLQMYKGAADACAAYGYQMVICELDVAQDGALARFETQLRAQPLDGIFVTAPLSDNVALLDMLERLGVRYVRHSPLLDQDRSDAVFADDVDGASRIARHLWALGHRRFGMVNGPPGHLASRLRQSAFCAEILRLGGHPDDIRVLTEHDIKGKAMPGFDEAGQLLSGARRPSAIFAFNDVLAAGILAQAHQMGLNLPEDLAVVGYGNADFSLLTWPQLTTVRQPNYDMAKCAVEWLTQPRADKARTITFPVELIERGSCAPAKA